jgi:hypothetical protein
MATFIMGCHDHHSSLRSLQGVPIPCKVIRTLPSLTIHYWKLTVIKARRIRRENKIRRMHHVRRVQSVGA